MTQRTATTRPADSASTPSSVDTTARRRWSQRHYWALLLILIALFSVSVRLLDGLQIDHSGLLYVALPFSLALALLLFTTAPYRGLYGVLRGALIVLLGSSAILHEGFLCVIFLAPIYFLMVLLAYGVYALWRVQHDRPGRLRVSILPVLVLLSSLEGVTPATTLPRHQVVQVALAVPMQAAEIRQRLLAPSLFPQSDDWLLWLFPMPYRIEAGGVQTGAIHEVFFEYRRWIFTNIKRGSLQLRLDSVDDRQITVQVLSDSSYLSTYLGLQRSRFDLLPLANGATQVQLTVWFERRLDPAWYFQPLQRHAVKDMGLHILKHSLAAEHYHEG